MTTDDFGNTVTWRNKVEWCDHCKADRPYFHNGCPGNVNTRAARADAAEAELRRRGSRARYRRAVAAFVEQHQCIADIVYHDAARGPVEYLDALGFLHTVPVRDYLAWHERAELRARRILAAIDGGGR